MKKGISSIVITVLAVLVGVVIGAFATLLIAFAFGSGLGGDMLLIDGAKLFAFALVSVILLIGIAKIISVLEDIKMLIYEDNHKEEFYEEVEEA